MTIRETLHRRIDALPDGVLPEIERLLAELEAEEAQLPAFLRDAPIDDEPETEFERAAVAAAYAARATGNTVAHEDVRREFGV
ncbi:MAG: hypothetical protein ACYDCQ_19165 [Dehalococcoidia bacterium]